MSASINTSTALPHIPTLPPIEIPDSSILRSSLDHHLPPLDEDAHLSPHAFTSPSRPSHRQPAGSSNDTSMSSPTHLSPTSPSLRKSFSVDSFSRQSRPPPVSSTSRQHKAFPTVTAAEEPPRALPSPWQPQGVDSPQVSCFPRDPSFPLSGRSRGASISTIGDENNQSIPEESDVEVVRDAPQLSTGPRRTGSKIKIKLRPPLPPELLPSSKLHDTIPASPESTAGVNDATPRLPSAMAPTFSYRAPKAGPSSQLSEDITTAGSASGSSTPCTDFGSGLQPVSLIPLSFDFFNPSYSPEGHRCCDWRKWLRKVRRYLKRPKGV
jgi:hypothetical protein